jgi:lysophospholipase L1-like esterase
MKIGVWGDSITYGGGDSEALGWVGRVNKAFPVDAEINIYNRGVCGDTTKDLLKRFAIEAESIQPDSIIFAIGINDSKYSVRRNSNIVPIDIFRKNMQELVGIGKKYTEHMFIIGLTKVDESVLLPFSRFSNRYIEEYTNALKEFSKKKKIKYIDMFEVLEVKTDLCDGVHPNERGYEKMARVISPFLQVV